MSEPVPDIASTLLGRVTTIDDEAASELLALVYDELRDLAGAYMRRERTDHTLQPTALVNEAFLKLVRTPDNASDSRARFLGVAARAMRQILVDHARAHRSAKRGDGWDRVTMRGVATDTDTTDPVDALALDAALDKLGAQDQRLARVVELRFFGGLTIPETARALGVSHTTVESDWAFARAWLRREIEGEGR